MSGLTFKAIIFNIPVMSSSDFYPPSADSEQAEKYINKLVKLMDHDIAIVHHTDLSKFDFSTFEDHYWIDLDNFRIEVSHSKRPDTGIDSYVIIFTNIKHMQDNPQDKVILAYIHLHSNQFIKFKSSAQDQLERRRKEEEEKKFKEAMSGVDEALEKLTDNIPEEDKRFEGYSDKKDDVAVGEKTVTNLGSTLYQ